MIAPGRGLEEPSPASGWRRKEKKNKRGKAFGGFPSSLRRCGEKAGRNCARIGEVGGGKGGKEARQRGSCPDAGSVALPRGRKPSSQCQKEGGIGHDTSPLGASGTGKEAAGRWSSGRLQEEKKKRGGGKRKEFAIQKFLFVSNRAVRQLGRGCYWGEKRGRGGEPIGRPGLTYRGRGAVIGKKKENSRRCSFLVGVNAAHGGEDTPAWGERKKKRGILLHR